MWLKSAIVRTKHEKNERTITRSQGRNREVGSEGRLWETCELMNKNRIEGRRVAVNWHHTAKPFGSRTEVNAAVVQGSIECLPREASTGSGYGLKSAKRIVALPVAIPGVLPVEESAEGEVVASQPVSSGVSLICGEEYGKAMRSKARTEEEETTGGAL